MSGCNVISPLHCSFSFQDEASQIQGCPCSQGQTCWNPRGFSLSCSLIGGCSVSSGTLCCNACAIMRHCVEVYLCVCAYIYRHICICIYKCIHIHCVDAWAPDLHTDMCLSAASHGLVALQRAPFQSLGDWGLHVLFFALVCLRVAVFRCVFQFVVAGSSWRADLEDSRQALPPHEVPHFDWQPVGRGWL